MIWLRSKVVQIGLAVAALFAAIAALRRDAYRDGKKEVATGLREKDHERADEIRRRGDAARAAGGGVVRPDDDRGYRD